MGSFDNQIAVITGAGTGLGAAIARALAAQGARCVLAGRRPAPLEAVGAEIAALGGPAPLAQPTDVSDPAQVDRLMDAALGLAGRIDLLVNAAGIFRLAPLEDTSLALFDDTLAVNLRGAFLCCRAAWPHLRRAGGGQIVNLSSVAGVQAFEGNAAYSASKFGLTGLSAVLALEGRPHNIRVFAVCPAAADTAAWDGQAPEAARRRMLRPEPLAAFVAWLLASPHSLAFDPVIIRNFHDPWGEV
jgi:3-oxoacyl-[acyl-carrier protein] reductase